MSQNTLSQNTSQNTKSEASGVSDELNRLIWIDLEMTGLIVESEVIIEIATVVTDANLETIAEGPVLAVKQPERYLEKMDEWNQRHHGGSGLLERVRQSDVDTATAEQQTLAFLREHLRAGQSPMCGNSVCQDRRFLARYMPELESFFHYRNLDVSTVKELARRWRPEAMQLVSKRGHHLAMDDIYDSIAELKVYREAFFTVS
ncbi:MAG: oligoribonuclease [Gammaproteobacteria bacterium]